MAEVLELCVLHVSADVSVGSLTGPGVHLKISPSYTREVVVVIMSIFIVSLVLAEIL